jgi:DNA-binding XRE family transcriptional regulator
MKLIAKDKNILTRKKSEITGITRDGWVVTKDGAFGDLGSDCDIELDMTDYLKRFRKIRRLSQKEMGWILGVSRPAYWNCENGKRDLSLKEFLILSYVREDNEFEELRDSIAKIK